MKVETIEQDYDGYEIHSWDTTKLKERLELAKILAEGQQELVVRPEISAGTIGIGAFELYTALKTEVEEEKRRRSAAAKKGHETRRRNRTASRSTGLTPISDLVLSGAAKPDRWWPVGI